MWILSLLAIITIAFPIGSRLWRRVSRLIREYRSVKNRVEIKPIEVIKPVDQKQPEKPAIRQEYKITGLREIKTRFYEGKFKFSGYIKQQREIEFFEFSREPGSDDIGEQYNDDEIDRMIKAMCSMLYQQAREEREESTKFMKAVLSNGGIKRYNNGHESEEYDRNVPIWYRRKNGLTPDEMAGIMDFETDTELYQAIQKAENIRKSSKELKLSDFYNQAVDSVLKQVNGGNPIVELAEVPF